MTEHVTGLEYAEVFADIYNNAIELFEEDARESATADIFIPQLENDVNFIEIQESGDIAAFLSYHQYGNYYELTSLYVKREYQRKGIGQKSNLFIGSIPLCWTTYGNSDTITIIVHYTLIGK